MNNTYKKIHIPKCAKLALSLLENAGYEAWIVGGFIRDSILYPDAIIKTDIDITTNALPNQTQSVFNKQGWHTYELGKKFGTIVVLYKDINYNKKIKLEITTYRSESNYEDGRHPKDIKFEKSILEDLKRRDFTINAIAYNPKNGFFDPYNGIFDINHKVIKTVGDPKIRFSEDYLRIIRALRFASVHKFNIDINTDKQIIIMKDKLNLISIERIRYELSKLLCGPLAKKILNKYKEVIFSIIPELKPLDGFDQKTKYHQYDIYMHTLCVLENASIKNCNFNIKETEDKDLQLILKWASLLHDIGKPNCFSIDKGGQGHFYGHPKTSADIAKKILKRYKFSTNVKKCILLLIEHHDYNMHLSKKSIKKMLRKFYEAGTNYNEYSIFKIFLELRKADSLSHHNKYQQNYMLNEQFNNLVNEIINNKEAFKISDLKINGIDILNMGIKPGPQISAILNKCIESVIDESIQNTKTDLMNFVKKYIKNTVLLANKIT